jgi:porin
MHNTCTRRERSLAPAIIYAFILGTLSPALAGDDGNQNPSIATSLPQNWEAAQLRAELAAKGLTYTLSYMGETLANAGGVRQGAIYEGRLEAIVEADLEKLWGFRGLAFHMHGFDSHGPGLSQENVQNILTVSSIEARATARLFELYLEQKLADAVSFRFGQLSADTEFFISSNGATFINSTLGWGGIGAADMPSGGVANPLAAPGVRIKVEPWKNITLLAAMYDGDPAGPGQDDPQDRDHYGTLFRVQDPPLLMQEAQWKYNQDKEAQGLPGTLKVGAWQHTGKFDDQEYDAAHVSMALSHNDPAKRFGDYGFYIVADQQIFRLNDGDPAHGVHVFARLSKSPEDRNLVSTYADGGIVCKGLIASHPDDDFGAAFAYAKISGRASDLDRDRNIVGASNLPIRDFEAIVEVYYKHQVIPGFTVQPDFQYVVHPGGHAAQNNGLAIKDAAVAGVRFSISY